MSPRERRLQADLQQMNELADRGTISFRCEGDPPEDYEVMFSVPGIALSPERRPVVRNTHRAHIYLHLDYPRRPPVVTWLTPVFHPNLLGPDQHGGVCIGSWSASEGLADLCARLAELVSYQSFNVDDALNPLAADWVRAGRIEPGVDVSELSGDDAEVIAESVVARVES